MTSQRRRNADAVASGLLPATQTIVLLVSANAVTCAHVNAADLDNTLLQQSVDERPEANRARPAKPTDTHRLTLHLDPLEARDSQFLRNLLLTHGIEIDLGQSGPLGMTTLEQLADHLDNETALGEFGITFLTEQKLDTALLMEMRDTLAAMPAADHSDYDRRTHLFALLTVPDAGDESILSNEAEAVSPQGERRGAFIVSDEAPAGFESLLGPITHYVDVRFNEQIVGTATITVTAETLTFDDPASIPPLLDGVLDPDSLLPFLQGEFDTNAHLLCFAPDDPEGCGIVDAFPVSALFDESTLTLDVFVSPALQALQDFSRERYLDSPERRGTSILSVSAVATDLQDKDLELDLYFRGLAGYGRGNLSAEIEHSTRSKESHLEEFRLTHYFRDQELTVGSFNYSPGAGLGDANLVGAQFQTSYKTRVDLEQAFSSDLVVYLPRRSIVQLVINDRIYSGASYSAGNQKLDTRALPDGTYEIEIRILEGSGVASSEFRVFSKSTEIPPPGEWVFSLTAGMPLFFSESPEQDDAEVAIGVDKDTVSTSFLPTTRNTSIVGASITRRLTDQSAWQLGLLGLGRDAAVQGGFIYLGQRLSAQFAASLGSSGLVTTVSRISLSFKDISASASALTSRHDANSDSADTGIPLDDFDQTSLKLSRRFGETQLSLRSTWRRNLDEGRDNVTRQNVLSARRSLFRRRELRGYLTAELQHDEDITRVGITVNTTFDRRPFATTVFGGLEQIERETSHVVGVSTQYNVTALESTDWEFGAYATSRDEGDNVGLSLGVDTNKFSAIAATDWSRTDASFSRSSVASLSAHAGLDIEGVAIGGKGFSESGLIIDVDGNPEGAIFDVFVNNRNLATGRIGTPQFVALAPIQNYRIKLVPRSLLSNGIGEEIYDFTLFPGSIKRISIEARREILLVASLVDARGELIVDALVQTDENPALIDSSGVFQAEVSPGAQLSVTLGDGQDCFFTVPDVAAEDEMLIPDDPLRCYPVE